MSISCPIFRLILQYSGCIPYAFWEGLDLEPCSSVRPGSAGFSGNLGPFLKGARLRIAEQKEETTAGQGWGHRQYFCHQNLIVNRILTGFAPHPLPQPCEAKSMVSCTSCHYQDQSRGWAGHSRSQCSRANRCYCCQTQSGPVAQQLYVKGRHPGNPRKRPRAVGGLAKMFFRIYYPLKLGSLGCSTSAGCHLGTALLRYALKAQIPNNHRDFGFRDTLGKIPMGVFWALGLGVYSSNLRLEPQ